MAAGFSGGSGYHLNGDATSISFRLRTTQAGSNIGLVGQANSSSSASGWSLLMTSGKLTFQGKQSTTQRILITGTATVNDGAWHDVVVLLRYDALGTCEIWVDGVQDASGTPSSTWGGNTNPHLGKLADTFWTNFTGEIAEFKGHAARLSPDQVHALHAGINPCRVTSALVYHLPLVRNVFDLRGAAITTVGTPTVTDHPQRIG